MDDRTEPTAEQCDQHAVMPDGTTACWWPQTGGYWGKAVARADPDGCVDVWVWHDGEFPFGGGATGERGERGPVELHHCDGGQFVQFGQFLTALSDAAMPEVSGG